MRVVKPSWVIHDSCKAIFSVDAEEGGKRFATGGQGDDASGLVLVWGLPALLHRPDPDSQGPPDSSAQPPARLLCRLDQQKAVNVVRFAHKGRLLASGGDDKDVAIWSYVGASGGAAGPDAAGAAGGLASNAEVWRRAAVLRGHEADVLHVEWDPADRLLASASVDNSVMVWDAAALPGLPSRLHVLRRHQQAVKGLAWDPVGRYLATQAADKTLHVWRTGDWELAKSLREPFADSADSTMFLRLGWATDGSALLAPHSTNNSAPTAQLFDRQKLERAQDLVGHRKATSCVRWTPQLFHGPSGKTQSPGGLVALAGRDATLSIWRPPFHRPLAVLARLSTGPLMDLAWTRVGAETLLLAASSDGTLAALFFSHKETGRVCSVAETDKFFKAKYGAAPSTSTVALANPSADFIDNPDALKTAKKAAQGKENSLPKPPSRPATPKAQLNSSGKQLETRTKDGKRRIQALFLGKVVEDSPKPVRCEAHVSKASSSGSGETPAPSAEPPVPPSPTKPPSQPLGLSLKRKAVPTSSPAEPSPSKRPKKPEKPQPTPSLGQELKRTAAAGSAVATTPPTPAAGSAASTSAVAAGQPTIKAGIPLPGYRAKFSLALESAGEELSVRAGPRGRRQAFSSVQLLRSGTKVWEAVVEGSLVCVASSGGSVVVGLESGDVRVLSRETGALAGPLLRLDGAPVHMASEPPHLFVLTSQALGYLWHWAGAGERPRALAKPHSLASLLEGSAAGLESVAVRADGTPVVRLAGGKSFGLSLELGCWEVVGWPAEEGPGAVRRAGAETGLEAAQRGAGVLGWLESRVEAARAGARAGEEQRWLGEYVGECAAQSATGRLRELFGRLLRSRLPLLQLLLPRVAHSLPLQPLYAEFTHLVQRHLNQDKHSLF